MDQQLTDLFTCDIRNTISNKDLQKVSKACLNKNLFSNDIHRVHDENVSWLRQTTDRIPIWSRLKVNSCVNQPTDQPLNKKGNYNIEIPGCLLSLFGSGQQQIMEMNKIKYLENYYTICCILTLCSALKYHFLEWSPKLLDDITIKAVQLYPKILPKQSLTDKQFNMHHLNQIFQFQGTDYQVKQQQVATGFLYIRYGLNKFNLSRALNWFFQYYQFGIVHCGNRFLAFGFTLDSEYGFFMYDCQSRGFPLFKYEQANSYILRSSHLQVLLYCMIVSLNCKDGLKFSMYNVDVRILLQSETKNLKKEKYVPILLGDSTKKVDGGTIHKGTNSYTNKTTKILNMRTTMKAGINTSPKIFNGSNKSIQNTINKTKSVNKYDAAKGSVNKTLSSIKSNKSIDSQKTTANKSAKSSTNTAALKAVEKNHFNNSALSINTCIKKFESPTKIPIDPNKKYYIIAVPKKPCTDINISSPKQDHILFTKTTNKKQQLGTGTSQTTKASMHCITKVKPQQNENILTVDVSKEDEMELDLDRSDSSRTLICHSVNSLNDVKKENYLGLRVYLVNNRSKGGL